MRPSKFSKMVIRAVAGAFVAAVIIPVATVAQTFAASVGTDAIVKMSPPPTEARIRVPSHPKDGEDLLYGRVRNGLYTVDGIVAKLQLNYEIQAARYLYLFVPGLGTAVVADTAFPDSVAGEARLEGNTLRVKAGDHTFQLVGVALQDGKGSVPAHLFVKLDRSAWHLSRQPMVGFGQALSAPFEWPAAIRTGSVPAQMQSQLAPPVPSVLLPSLKPVTPPPAPPVTVSAKELQPVVAH